MPATDSSPETRTLPGPLRRLARGFRRGWDAIPGEAWARLLARLRPADIAFFFKFHRPPYGGGNQFLTALWKELVRQGYRLETNRISRVTRACLLNSHHFDPGRLRRWQRQVTWRRDGCRFVHRVDGPLTVYRGVQDGSDRAIWELNQEFAMATIFQSRYSLEKHLELGLHMVNPQVIPNAADPRIFHPHGRIPFDPSRRIRLVSVSWSDNPNKGGALYAWLERRLDWTRFEYLHIGRISTPLTKARVIPPLGSQALARWLRQQDIYLTASQHEACSNSLIEALSCGLPALYLDSGSNAEVAGEGGLSFHSPEELLAQLERLVAEYPTRQAAISLPGLPEIARRYASVLVGEGV